MQRRIVITGVNRGLGRELARVLAERGHRVWGTSRNGEAPGGLEACVALDVRDDASIRAAVREISGETDGIDLLINSAGADARSFGAPEEGRGPFDVDAAMFNAVFDVNATGPMLVTKHLLPLLQAGSDSMIVNISSQLGSMQVAARKGRDTAYCVSKAALNMLSVKSAEALRGDKIGVVMLHPGWLTTDMGGPGAQLDLADTSQTIASTIETLGFADTGRFVRWDGHDHPW
ncbi:MAG: SDR family oxidoreductase [Ilumatobacter sp.]